MRVKEKQRKQSNKREVYRERGKNKRKRAEKAE